MKIAQLFILILAFFIIKPAAAGLLIEPVLGYSVLSKLQMDEAGAEKDKGNGISVGGRLGYQNLGFQLGIDYLRSSYKIDDNDYKENLSANEFAGFVGFEFPILFRVYAGYIFAASAETQYDGGTGKEKLEFSDGSGTKLGVGFTGLPFVDINFEYRTGKYGKYKLGGETTKQDTNFNAYMVSISLPFVL